VTAEVRRSRIQIKEENRRAILAAAHKAFVENGFGATTVRDIIRHSDLSVGTFYNYFNDKEEVLSALLERNVAKLTERIHAARREASDLEGFVRAGFQLTFAFVAADPEFFRLIRRNFGTIRSLLDGSIQVLGIQRATEDIQNAIARGIIPPLDASYLAAGIAGIGFEVSLRMMERRPIDVEGAVETATRFVVGGIEALGRRPAEIPAIKPA
jgi:AcrR family transcriptional regulator